MKIKQVIGREILDSRGLPTVECELILQTTQDQLVSVKASVPSGLSKGKYEALEMRDGGTRLEGKGVLQAIENLETKIAPLLIGKEPDVVSCDIKIIELDGTDNKSNLGANATLAASIAILRAQAILGDMEPYELIASLCSLENISIPVPMLNFIHGGVHASNSIDIQEIMIIPTKQSNFRSAIETSLQLFYNLKAACKQKGLGECIGDEGGLAPNIKNNRQALDLLMEVIEKTTEGNFAIALDIAASRLYNPKKNTYALDSEIYSSDELLTFYEKLIDDYPIISIEDGFAEDDWQGWKSFTKEFGQKIQIIGDDLFTTNPQRILKGVEEKAANAVLIKPNQIGTITETLQAIATAVEHNLATIISHRSGETNDHFIVDLAIGTQAGQIKAGGLCRGERLSKYNRILRIEDKLTRELLNS